MTARTWSNARAVAKAAEKKRRAAHVARVRTDPWRAKLMKKTPHALMQLEYRGGEVVALCHCGWVSTPSKTEGAAKSKHTKHANA